MGVGRRGSKRVGASLIAAVAAVALVACGGDDEGEAESGPSAADEAAIEQLILDYAAIKKGAAGCDLWSQDVLARTGGRAACEQVYANRGVTETYNIEEIEVDGDSGSVLVTVHPGEGQRRYPVVREGEPTDSYDGWRVDEVVRDKVRVTGTETTAQTATTTPTTTTQPPTTTASASPQTPEQKLAAYRTCIEGRGAQGIKEDPSTPPSVEFSGGGSTVIAAFAADDADAQQGFAAIQQRKPFIVKRFGTVILYSVGDPLADDLETGLACAKEVG